MQLDLNRKIMVLLCKVVAHQVMSSLVDILPLDTTTILVKAVGDRLLGKYCLPVNHSVEFRIVSIVFAS